MKSTKNYVEEFLQQPKGVNKSWFRTLMVFVIAIIGYGILLGLSIDYGNFLGESPSTSNYGKTFSDNLTNNANLTEAVGVISILSFCLIALPFVSWFSLWMIGINQVSKSPYFHLFMWLIAALLMTLLLICIIMFIRASVYDPNSAIANIPTPEPAPTEPTA